MTIRIVLLNLCLIVGFTLVSYSQNVPQSLNYSSVVRDSNGKALANRDVSFRLSILSGSATGSIEYQETHIDKTDQWGVSNLSIGSGAVVQGIFSSINWGSTTFYLQIELDDNAGSNYQMMGTIQFLSVPYALYAETSGSSRTLDYPDGINNLIPITTNSYTVPAGKNFYITESKGPDITIDDFTMNRVSNFVNPLIVGPNQMVTNFAMHGFLVDASVTPVTMEISSEYLVPPGMQLFITNISGSSNIVELQVDGIILTSDPVNNRVMNPYVINAGSILSAPMNPVTLNGYLK